MRAAILREYGSAPRLAEDWPEPAGECVVEVLAAGLNPVDLRIASGHFYGAVPDLPYVPGGEGVGLHDGLRIYFAGNGTLAERADALPASLVAVPEQVADGPAVACGVAGATAWLALERADLRAGETVLVLGASGTVGRLAVQAAAILGAGRVVAAARSARGLARAGELGADALVELDDADDLDVRLREACRGEGPDVVIDPLWGPPAEAAVRACHHGSRLVGLGESAGATASFTSADVRGKELRILGFALPRVDAIRRREATARLLGLVASGALQVDVEEVPLERVGDAWRRQAASPGVKLVLRP